MRMSCIVDRREVVFTIPVMTVRESSRAADRIEESFFDFTNKLMAEDPPDALIDICIACADAAHATIEGVRSFIKACFEHVP
jgi:hypothetical protein